MFAQLSNSNLHERFIYLVKLEKKTTAGIVEFISEMDRRKLFFEHNCTSMHQYLTQVAGYSEAAAQRRISSARLMQQVPEIKKDLVSGELNLSQVSSVAQALKQKKKTGKVSAKQTKELLDLVKNKNAKETQLIVSQELDLPLVVPEKQRMQKDESVRCEFTLSKEEYEMVMRARELLSHVNPEAKTKDVLVYLSEEFLKRKDPLKKKPTSAAEVKPSKAQVRIQIHQRDRCCQWRDPVTGEQCGSTFQLEHDHIEPKWAGGTDDPENFQLLCRAHNQLRYKQQAGLHSVAVGHTQRHI